MRRRLHKAARPPMGRLNGTFDQLQEAGCIQAESEEVWQRFSVLQIATMGNICNGCPVWDEKGKGCKAYALYHSEARQEAFQRARRIEEATTPQNSYKFDGMSMKQIAKELGISLSEARRRKQQGELE